MAVDLTKLIDFDLLQRYDTKLKSWVEKKIIESNQIIFITENSLPAVGNMNLLYVTEDSIFLWDGSAYIKVGGQGTGATFIPSIDKNADLTWTNNAGLPNPTPVNVRGPAGKDGKSAYDIAVENGFVGNAEEWLESLKGGDGVIGKDGKSAYELAVAAGFEGDEEEWLASLKGTDGKTVYEIAVDNGFEGTEEEWLESLKGADGNSPTVSLSPTENGVEVTITDENGSHVFELENGDIGKDGPAVVSMRIDENYHLISTLSNGVEIDAGKIDIEGLTIEKTEVIDVKLMTDVVAFDGETTQFSLPTDSKTLMVYVNGLCLKEGSDYTISDGTITFNDTFDTTDVGVLHWLDKNSADSNDTLWATEEDIDKLFSGDSSGENGGDSLWAKPSDIDDMFK